MFNNSEYLPYVVQSKEIESKILTISPKLASKILHNYNYGNRPMSMSTVQHYAEQMRLDRWILSPQPIIFSKKKGRLLDGQHRLKAVCVSNKTIKASCAIVEDEKVFKVLDQGKNRSNADILSLPHAVTGAMQFLLRIQGIGKVVAADIEPYLNTTLHHRLEHIIEKIRPRDRRFKNHPFRAAFAVATCTGANFQRCSEAYAALSHLDFENCNEIMKALYYQFDKGFDSVGVGGRNPNNDYFIRGLYMFYNLEGRKNTIKISEQFKQEVKHKLRLVMDTWRSGK